MKYELLTCVILTPSLVHIHTHTSNMLSSLSPVDRKVWNCRLYHLATFQPTEGRLWTECLFARVIIGRGSLQPQALTLRADLSVGEACSGLFTSVYPELYLIETIITERKSPFVGVDIS